MSVLIIAECGSCWEGDLAKAEQLIKAVKACGADVAKVQWTSDANAMVARRKLGPEALAMYERYLAYPKDVLMRLKSLCDSAGIEFACTVYLPQDIEVINPLVKRFKVSAFEATDQEFVREHGKYDKQVIVSINPSYLPLGRSHRAPHIKLLQCISKYPTDIKELDLGRIAGFDLDGLSDHSTSVLSGAVAVGCGAEIIEKHVRLMTTTGECPDYDHSLVCDMGYPRPSGLIPFNSYVQNIREAESML